MVRVFDLLIVDDDPDQLGIVEMSLRELGLLHRCHYASSGLRALDFLKRRPPFENAPRPDLILMDLNMPGMGGCDVLHEVKSDVELRAIPVVMLSTSQSLQDVNACYKEHANAYVRKAPDLQGNLNLFRDIDRFWAGTALLP